MNQKWHGLFFGALCALFSGVGASATVYYVNVGNPTPASPFTTWASASTDIQSAVNLANPGDEVLVTNGVYQTGATSFFGSNRVYVAKSIMVQSVNGPLATVIKGNQVPGIVNAVNAVRCVYLAAGATLSGFTLTNGSANSSSAFGGGGVCCPSTQSTVSNCLVVGNESYSAGGGGYYGTYYNCIIGENYSSGSGGGVAYGILSDCQVADNTAVNGGGGAYIQAVNSGLTNCLFYGNTAAYGGGVYGYSSPPWPSLNNCSIVANYASSGCGGVWGGALTNCIVYYNTAAPFTQYGTNVASTTNVVYTCTPSTNGLGANNITAPPGFINVDGGNLQLAAWSPCINAGNNAAVNSSADLAGNPRIVNGTVDMGAYEFQGQFYPTVHFVNLSNTTPVSPFTTWATAATNIQNAIDASAAGDFVLVSNGTYNVGGRAVYGLQTNRVTIDQPITVQAFAGARYTAIAGTPNGPRCVYLTNGAVLLGFTLTNGAARFSGENVTNENGGGAWCESSSAILSNCVLTANLALHFGGGSYSGTLVNCSFAGNTTTYYGAGSYNSDLVGCTLSNNLANPSLSTSCGGGAFGGVLTNCLLLGNFAASGGGACSNVLYGCSLTTNRASKSGGGAYFCTLTNCFLAFNAATNGGGAAYGTLANCTLNGNLAGNGGGAFSNTLFNCLLTGNDASTNGGGVMGGNLLGCVLSGNVASDYGGGSYYSNLTNCTVTGNYAQLNGLGLAGGSGSGCYISNNIGIGAAAAVYSNTLISSIISSNIPYGSEFSTLIDCSITRNFEAASQNDSLYNCIVFANSSYGAVKDSLVNCTVLENGFTAGAPQIEFCYATNCIVYYGGPENYYNSTFDHCCTIPLPPGNGNFTNAPLFVDDAFHPATNSPCIDAGNNAVVYGTTDRDGRLRIVNGIVDIGAMEYQGASLEPFISWLYQYGLPDDGSADYADSDGTGMDNWQKWIAGLNPTNALSVLEMSSLLRTNTPPGITVTWQSVTNVTYYLQRSSDLLNFTAIQSNLVGQASSTRFTDATATNNGPYFYRVAVQQ